MIILSSAVLFMEVILHMDYKQLIIQALDAANEKQLERLWHFIKTFLKASF